MPDIKEYEYKGYLKINPTTNDIEILEEDGTVRNLVDVLTGNDRSSLKLVGTKVRRATIKLYAMPYAEEQTARYIFVSGKKNFVEGK